MGFISQEDPHNADELMRALAKPYADSAIAQYAVAAVALQADDAEFAMARAQRAIELDPDWLKPKLLYGRAMLMAGESGLIPMRPPFALPVTHSAAAVRSSSALSTTARITIRPRFS